MSSRARGARRSTSFSCPAPAEGEREGEREGEHEGEREGEREGEPALAAAKRRKVDKAAAAAPSPPAHTSRAGRITGWGNPAAAVQRAPAATSERRSKDERNVPVLWAALRASVASGKFPKQGAKLMASVRKAVEKVLLVFEAGGNDQRYAAWMAEKERMEAAYAGGAAAIAGCEVK